ncbi:sulfotransferase family 2 domain-containing protein [Marinicella litoralis]|uniref:Sulfotransferase family protein n=1 Tax=Marinicella litoralis TaxID=644220 RepID=A0A4R6Y404_9GAMM|nr:sulfotransferase family 2 domain-containing protein [Marinicella litoralis]TDR23858.1 sulfotransferase family protein [Marinicella litoralis]
MKAIAKLKNGFKVKRRYLKRKIHTFPLWYQEPDYIFIHINKTGGSSIEKALNLPFEHLTALEKIQEVGTKKWQEKFTFAFVRNPFDKVCSHYRYRVKTNQTQLKVKPLTFSEWVQLSYGERDPDYYDKPKMFMPQTQWLCDNAGQLLVDEVYQFEKLHTDFAEFCQKLEISDAQLPHLKASQSVDYRAYYDANSKAIIEQRFASDLARFNYQF